MTNNIVALVCALLAASAAMGQITTNLPGCPQPPAGYAINCSTMQLLPLVTVASTLVPAPVAPAVSPSAALTAAIDEGKKVEAAMASIRQPGISYGLLWLIIPLVGFMIAGAAVWSWWASQQHPTVHVHIQPAQGTANVDMIPQVQVANANAAAGAGAPAAAAAAAAGAGAGGGGGVAAAAAGPWMCVCGRNNPAATAFCGNCGRPHP